MELGVHAGEWSALPCGSAAALPVERDYPLTKGSNNTHTHTPGTQVDRGGDRRANGFFFST
jgi:hypothetical protein